MRSILILILSIVNSALVFAQDAEFSFVDDTHKFGRVDEGPLLKHTYYFTNTGTEPMVITDMKVSCTCTKYRFPLKPVMPGAQDSIMVSFDTVGKIGFQDRTLNIYANTKKNPTPIRFKVFVKNKD